MFARTYRIPRKGRTSAMIITPIFSEIMLYYRSRVMSGNSGKAFRVSKRIFLNPLQELQRERHASKPVVVVVEPEIDNGGRRSRSCDAEIDARGERKGFFAGDTEGDGLGADLRGAGAGDAQLNQPGTGVEEAHGVELPAPGGDKSVARAVALLR